MVLMFIYYFRSDNVTQDLMSVAYSHRISKVYNPVYQRAEYDIIRKVQRHEFDFKSPEVIGNFKKILFVLMDIS